MTDRIAETDKLLKEVKQENEQLKHKLQQQEMEHATDLHRLAEENEQLKSDAGYWAKTAEARLKKIEQLKHRLAISEKANLVTTLEKENEKLKLELGTYKEANKTLKQTIDRILTDNIHYKTKLKRTNEKGVQEK
jgi:cell shape-determining protein MreC